MSEFIIHNAAFKIEIKTEPNGYKWDFNCAKFGFERKYKYFHDYTLIWGNNSLTIHLYSQFAGKTIDKCVDSAKENAILIRTTLESLGFEFLSDLTIVGKPNIVESFNPIPTPARKSKKKGVKKP